MASGAFCGPAPLFSGRSCAQQGFLIPFRMKDEANDKLFETMPADIRRLNKKAKQEKRQKEREQYARDKGLREIVREGP